MSMFCVKKAGSSIGVLCTVTGGGVTGGGVRVLSEWSSWWQGGGVRVLSEWSSWWQGGGVRVLSEWSSWWQGGGVRSGAVGGKVEG